MIGFTPQPSILALLDRVDGEWVQHDDFNQWVATNVGTGASTRTVRKVNSRTGATAASTNSCRTAVDQALSRGKALNVLNWSKKIVLHFIISTVDATTNGIGRFTMGKTTGTGVGALALKGIGVQVDNLALKGLAHNGTTLATVNLNTTLVDNQVYHLVIKSDGAGRIEWFVDGLSKGSSTGGPTGDSAGDENLFQLETDNGADAAAQSLSVHNLKYFVEQ